jgi:hypothetical protein
MRHRTTPKTQRGAPRRPGHQRQTRSSGGLPIGLTLYYYPHSKKLAPTLHDPELERRVHRGLAQARALLARRGSVAIIQCVLVTVPHGEAFWLGEDD